LVSAALVQDRDGERRVLDRAKTAMPSLALVFAYGGYAEWLVDWARRTPRIVLEIVRKPEGQRGFAVLPAAVGGRADAVGADRAPAPGPGLRTALRPLRAWVKWAMIGLMTRWLAPTPGRKTWT
jgi:hypothetical protein